MIHGSVFEVSLPSPGLTQHLPFFVSKNGIISLLIVSSTWSSVTGQMKNVCLIIMSNHTKSLPGKFQKKATGWKKKKSKINCHIFLWLWRCLSPSHVLLHISLSFPNHHCYPIYRIILRNKWPYQETGLGHPGEAGVWDDLCLVGHEGEGLRD